MQDRPKDFTNVIHYAEIGSDGVKRTVEIKVHLDRYQKGQPMTTGDQSVLMEAAKQYLAQFQ